jgi:hypothetical protein
VQALRNKPFNRWSLLQFAQIQKCIHKLFTKKALPNHHPKTHFQLETLGVARKNQPLISTPPKKRAYTKKIEVAFYIL